MTTRIKTVLALAVVAVACLALTTSAQAGLKGQLGLLDEAWFAANTINPGTGAPWKAGDTYHLAFSTVTTVKQCTYPTRAPADPEWTDIANWDAVVQAEADAAGIGTSVGVSWNVIGSTSTVNARDHAVASGPVFTCVGNPIASDYADMWDGAVANPITHIDGTPVGSPSYANLVLTGSNSDGTKTNNPLGDTDTFCTWGNPGFSDAPGNYPKWMMHTYPNQDMNRPGSVYALSEPLKVLGREFDVTDYIALKTHMGQETSAGETEGDFDEDGDVDWDDLQILQDAFREQNEPNPVPEPATLMLLLGAGLPALLKRRRS